MKSFTKEEILNLLENPTSLKNAIIESKGFVLYQSAFYKIDIPKKLLIDNTEYSKMSKASNPYGDGHASERIVDAIINKYNKKG